MRNGFQVVAVCASGAQAITAAESVNSGIVVSGYRFEDMMYDELRQCLPAAVDMLLIASPSRWSGQNMKGMICLPMPLKVHDLVDTLLEGYDFLLPFYTYFSSLDGDPDPREG